MEVFTGDRRMPTDVVFYPTDSLTHFPSSDVNPYTHQHRPDNPPPPPQKLRPIRCNGPRSSNNLASDFQQETTSGGLMSCYHPLEEEEDSGGFLLTQQEEEEKQTSADAVGGAVLVGSCALPENVLGNTSSLVGAAESLKLLAQTQQQFQFSISPCTDDADETPEAIQEPSNRKRKRMRMREKLETFVESMMKSVMQKQEQFHRQMITLLEKKENERIIREEAWKQQEIERAERERQERAQETSRSLALISFIQNLMGHEIHVPTPLQTPSREKERGGIQNQEEFKCLPSNNQEAPKYDPVNNQEDLKFGSGNNQEELVCDPNNRRWPKSEVQALITVRASLCHKFNANGSKNSIWEEVAVGMVKSGYSRTAKKCKEKWDNINKYYKRLVENGTKRSDTTSKVCPYFYELDMLYKSGFMVWGRENHDPSKKDMEEQCVKK